jgi:hypothetical protein
LAFDNAGRSECGIRLPVSNGREPVSMVSGVTGGG